MKKTTEYQEKEEILKEIKQLEKECSASIITNYTETYVQSLRPIRELYLIMDKSKYKKKNNFFLQKFGQKLGKMEFRLIIFLLILRIILFDIYNLNIR